MSKTFLKLIQPHPFDNPLDFNESSLLELDRLANTHNLFMLVYSRLKQYCEKYGSNNHIDKYLQEKNELRLYNLVVSLLHQNIEKEILHILNKNSIPCAAIKGNTLASDIYDDPNCRSSADIDFLIRKNDAALANSILLNSGYKPDIEIPFNYCLLRLHHVSYLHSKHNVLIEMHWHFGLQHQRSLSSEDIWKDIFINEAGFYKLTPEMTLIQLLLHHHHHALRELKILVDILWTFYKYRESLNIDRLFSMLKKIGLLKMTFITILQIEDLWEDAISLIIPLKKIFEKIKDSNIKAPVYIISYFKMGLEKSHNRNLKDRVMTRLLNDSLKNIFSSYLRALLLHPEAIMELYHEKSLLKLPVHYLRFFIWRIRE